ncbi:hypothetical protein GRF59_04535 [Paenibacillus sp. HJL G12]|uniref:Uncharacterized protein n=1 Tax=Paenibacillus dendrobii TaxID=2691084 RepID=A0A7X3IIX6_9BACL|nr:hypothetical protein [Paenibacillus dendrobii]MWV42887.1 hypothetical protein [Paenibacillus dendrobii]
MTTLILVLFTAAMIGVLIFGKKHEILIANIMNALLFIGLAVGFGLNNNPNGLFYLTVAFYFVIPMYGVIGLFAVMKKSRAKKQDSLV